MQAETTTRNTRTQRLYWSLNAPLRFMGLTLDEWAVFCIMLLPALYLLNADEALLGGIFALSSFVLTGIFRKVKKLSENFLVKSHLIARGFWIAPSSSYPDLIYKRVGK